MSEGPPDGPASIVDVARIAGVSRQTVSNVVNDRRGFSEETRAKVEAAIAATGYKPNRAARQLRTRGSRHIGFPLEYDRVDVRNPFTPLFLNAVAKAIQPLGHSLIVFACGPGDEDTLRSWARSGEVDGFVFHHVTTDDYRPRLLTELRMPFTVLGRTAPGQPQNWVDIDNSRAMFSLVDYLVGRGRRRFAYIDYGGPEHWVHERIDGTRSRLREHGFDLPDHALVKGDFHELSGPIDALLAAPDRPDTLICASDALALLASTRIQAAGLNVGDDVAVTGFDGGLQGWLVDRSLTTVRIPVERVAKDMIDRLMTVLDRGADFDEGLVVPTELIVGTSA